MRCDSDASGSGFDTGRVETETRQLGNPAGAVDHQVDLDARVGPVTLDGEPVAVRGGLDTADGCASPGVLVDVDAERLLVDVGTGASPRGPLRLSHEPQTVGVATYRIREREGRWVSEQLAGDDWTVGWTFTEQPTTLGASHRGAASTRPHRSLTSPGRRCARSSPSRGT